MLRSRSEDRSSVVILYLSGKLDAITFDDMEQVTKHLDDKGARKVVCDLANLSLLDSLGAGKLLSLDQSVRSKKGRLVVSNLANQPKEVFNILKMQQRIPVFDSVDKAVDTLHRSPRSFDSPSQS
jgi:anti-anti-sigma factor